MLAKVLGALVQRWVVFPSGGLGRFVLVSVTLLVNGTAQAQFYGNAVPAELLNWQAGNVWFGSVRNSEGGFVEGATVILDTGMIEYVAVTGVNGRFRLVLPEDTLPDAVSSSCARVGYARSVTQRRWPRGGDAVYAPIEVSCILH